MATFDLVTIGDASLDVFITPTESETLCRLDDKESLVCFSYGEKIPVKEMEFSVGGNAANNAVGTTRLGINTAVVLTLGDDEIGEQIVSKLEHEGVDTTYVFKQNHSGSNYSTVINYSGERTIFTYKAPRSYEYPVKFPSSPWIYLTSMGDSFMPFYNHLIDHLRINPQINLAFNPGSRQVRAGKDALVEILKYTKILYVNRKEAETISGFENSLGKERELLDALIKLGVKNPIVTDGGKGSFVYDGEKYMKVGILPVDAYERTGAGDAFGSGCITALIQGKEFREALVWGTVNSASVIGYTGSQKGLLKKDEMLEWIKRADDCEVKAEGI
jgi:sugar/nucleoside kinase (ribokinase family)